MKLSEIIYDIRSIAAPQLSDDTELGSDRQIEFWVNTVRSMLIRQDVNKGHSISDYIIQTLSVDLENVDASAHCGVTLGCPVLKSTKKIPQTIEFYHQNGIVSIGPPNMTKSHFLFIDFNRVPFITKGRFTKNDIYTFLKDDYLYVYTENPKYQSLKAAVLRGVFEKPSEASQFKSCTSDDPCYTNDSPYPIAGWMIDSLKNIILKNYLQLQLKTEVQGDTKDNAKQDTVIS